MAPDRDRAGHRGTRVRDLDWRGRYVLLFAALSLTFLLGTTWAIPSPTPFLLAATRVLLHSLVEDAGVIYGFVLAPVLTIVYSLASAAAVVLLLHVVRTGTLPGRDDL